MKTVQFIRELLAKGMSVEDALDMAEPFEDRGLTALASIAVKPDALEKRRAWDRERKAKNKVSANSTGIPPEPCIEQFHRNSTGIPPESGGLAHVRDKPLTSVLSGGTDADDCERADDWPEGSAKEHAARLIEICATSRLDMAREGGLALSMGLIHRWKAAGASWEFDVVPSVQALASKAKRPIKSWSYFDGAIADSVAANRQALAIPEAANVTPIRPGTGPPRPAITDRIAAENRQVRESLAAELERRNGQSV
jgi:hypothetical protein